MQQLLQGQHRRPLLTGTARHVSGVNSDGRWLGRTAAAAWRI